MGKGQEVIKDTNKFLAWGVSEKDWKQVFANKPNRIHASDSELHTPSAPPLGATAPGLVLLLPVSSWATGQNSGSPRDCPLLSQFHSNPASSFCNLNNKCSHSNTLCPRAGREARKRKYLNTIHLLIFLNEEMLIFQYEGKNRWGLQSHGCRSSTIASFLVGVLGAGADFNLHSLGLWTIIEDPGRAVVSSASLCYPKKNPVHFLVKLKDITKPKSRRRIYYLQHSKREHQGSFPKQKLENF